MEIQETVFTIGILDEMERLGNNIDLCTAFLNGIAFATENGKGGPEVLDAIHKAQNCIGTTLSLIKIPAKIIQNPEKIVITDPN